MEANILSMENITKVYPNGFVANKNVNFSIHEGEIHALVGENGAGKSTLMKMLFGSEKPDEGRILLHGKEVQIDNPTVAIGYGIGMVHQHFMLVPSLSVADNLVIGMEPKKNGLYDVARAEEIAREASEKYNLKVDPKARVVDLSVGLKQKVEILKALVRGAKILILDEPTAVLTPQETKELFVELKHLKNQGYTVVFISHKLNEVKELCDRITVLRAGRTIGVENVENVTEQDISRMMVGRDVRLDIDKEKAQAKDSVLRVSHINKVNALGKQVLKDVSFQIPRGVILGIAGVEGNGQSEISEIISGMDRSFEGEVEVNGKNAREMTVRQLRENGVAHISEDRMTYGIVGDGTIAENMISDRYYKKEFQKGLLLDEKKISDLAEDLIEKFNVKCDGKDQPIRMLSGGNMQKVVAAREFTSGADLIIANQPTRGIDIGASMFLRNKLVELRDHGAAVLLISADLSEVMEVSDRLIVMSNGRISAYFEDASEVTEEDMGLYMLGLKQMAPEEIRRASC
ncbi:MAG: ABC transporter ATP-binding protein [Lachnospiraceae bacterium]|nr:ABC transporter ATP-binding protein [Lachnospiraceae bacterium]